MSQPIKRHVIFLFVCTISFLTIGTESFALENTQSTHRYMPNQIIVKLKAGFEASGLTADPSIQTVEPIFKNDPHLFRPGHQSVSQIGLDGYYLIHLKPKPAKHIKTAIETLLARDEVESAQPNYIYESFTIPNDPLYSQQYAHRITRTEQAWDQEVGSANVVVAVIGTGVDIDHVDLLNNIWMNTGEIPDNGIDDDENGYVDDVYGWDFLNNNNDPRSSSAHETGVAGVVAAEGNNGEGVAGVSWHSKVMALQVAPTSASTAPAIDYARMNGAQIINMSFGNDVPAKYGDGLVKEALDAAYRENVLLIAAAGNSSCDCLKWPAALYNVIAVASTDQSDNRSFFSNYGRWVDMAAPGTNILTTDLNNTYGTSSGTSEAAPYVSGVAALILSHFPQLSNIEIRAVLENTADELNTGYDIGTGRVNSETALNRGNTSFPLGEIAFPGDHAIINVKEPIDIQFLAHGDYYLLEQQKEGGPNWITLDEGVPQPGEDGLVHFVFQEEPEEIAVTLRLTVQRGSAIHTDMKQYRAEIPEVLWVDTRGVGGTYQTIQEAIDAAGDLDEIRVVQGTYFAQNTVADLRSKKVDFKGGYPMVGSQQSDPEAYPAIISCPKDVRCVYLDDYDAVMDGFTITGGGMYLSASRGTISRVWFNQNRTTSSPGAALYVSGGAPTISNCVFSNNETIYSQGGGALFTNAGMPLVQNSLFISNKAPKGGAMANTGTDSFPVIEDSQFEMNEATNGAGGALWFTQYSGSAPLSVSRVVFKNNQASLDGGAVFLSGGVRLNATFTNCLFESNASGSKGGGIFYQYSPVSLLMNNTFYANQALDGSAVYNTQSPAITMVNSIARGSDREIVSGSDSVSVSYSNIEGGYAGEGNIDQDPKFVNPGLSNFHLRKGSLCINTGTSDGAPEDDLEGNRRPAGSGIDMGAYEFTLSASLSVKI
ncbi:MAG: hypothetical protein COV74_02050 [Candidatus Omnitrophica bacterium CG11_big_fil_rev_8_21_14_0_20_45_26]|uniref:Peptidase S8/S53 domain-containing protein n=1 Tax=Candidatus Abzuiibacterium crystallinum TaxID=1974748 RepID=A0A2H0LRN1_9BACT|nr:MAG: hypothetical protein COV74_02050 [Candidatus Omnitrophica bacterium CG11_big_fil_rev_8_21_14_0_20_45_26]PIW63312.1 MAG: hypothetical protein COW12_10900 [Candidatus Omnitrophica bacterium CG12_big_fil_rev_8_21_14_0_65_45_16]